MTDNIDGTLTANPDGGASSVPGDATPGAAVATPSGEGGQQAAPAQAQPQAPNLPRRTQAYVNENVRRAHDAERRAAAAEAAYKALTEQLNAERAKRPQASDAATAMQYNIHDAVRQSVAEIQQQSATTARAEATDVARQVWAGQLQDARERLPDFDTVTRQPNLAISNTMADALQAMEEGADVYYYLGKNPAVAEDIYALPPSRQAVAVARLVAKLPAPAAAVAAQTSRAPAPVPTVTGGQGQVTKRLADMTMEEYVKARIAGQTS